MGVRTGWPRFARRSGAYARAVSLYPFVPKTNAQLVPGQFWSIHLSDGRFACGRVLAVDRSATHGARTMFVAGLVDWVGERPPTAEAIAGKPIFEVGRGHVSLIAEGGGSVLGERPLDPDGIVPQLDPDSYWSPGYPVARAERRFIELDSPPAEDRREVRSPLTPQMLRPSPSGRGAVQFSSLLTDGDFARLAEWLRQYPEMGLRAYGSYDKSIGDLEFLRFFPSLRSFELDHIYNDLPSLDGLRHLPENVDSLWIGATERPLDLSILARFGSLKELYLERQTRNLDVISGLTTLEELTLRSITLPDLSMLLPLTDLSSLGLKLGGTTNLALLPRIGRIRYLELWFIRGLADIGPVGDMPHLEYLFLQALKQVETLPDFSGAPNLRRIHLQTMNGLRDLPALATAPALEELLLIDMRHLKPADLRPLAGIPQLKAVTAALGSLRRNAEAQALVGLPTVRGAMRRRSP